MYVFYINGGHVEKRFSKEFVNFICGGRIRHDIKSEDCTRKRLVIGSRYAARKLLAANKCVFWPDGTRFRCKLIESGLHRRQQRRPLKHRLSTRTRSISPLRNDAPSPMPAAADDDWYNNASFVEVDIEGGDDGDTLDSLHDDLQILSL